MALNINGTTGISGVDGSVSAPALTGTDSNTGITFPSADTIKFSTGGVERMSITNSGVTGTGIGRGKVLQVLHYQQSTQYTQSSETFADVNLSQAITPQTNSKVLISINLNSTLGSGGNGDGYGIKVFRDSTALYTSANAYEIYNYDNGTDEKNLTTPFTILDSSVGGDGSTSITYKVQVQTYGGATVEFHTGGSISTMTLMEIGA